MFCEEIKHLLNARCPGIWINTTEEKEVVLNLRNIFEELGEYEDVYTWSMTEGIQQIVMEEDSLVLNPISKTPGVGELQKHLGSSNDSKLNLSKAWILKDFHLVITNPQAIRMIRDIKESPIEKYTPIIIISPSNEIPLEFSGLFKRMEYDLPSTEDIAELVSGWATVNNQEAEEDEIEYLAKRLTGFNRKEILNLLNLSYAKYGSFDLDIINQKRIDAINDSGVLDYKVPTARLEDMGGNHNFKEWIEVVEVCMSEEAEEYGIPKPKGYLSIGIPGTSKSYSAEALAASWEIPLIKMNMAKINSRFAGDTERNMYKALNIVKSSAPCVLLIDEVEKSLGGVNSSNNSDSGAIARAFGLVLEFLNDNNGVFVVMTSNDVSQLPPELTRAGRLDATWYFSLPTLEERKEIFKIHFAKKGREVNDALLDYAAKNANKYTGAEIELAVNNTLKRAFLNYVKTGIDSGITEDVIYSAIKDVVPIAISSKEAISKLEEWSKGRALSANKDDKEKQEKQSLRTLRLDREE